MREVKFRIFSKNGLKYQVNPNLLIFSNRCKHDAGLNDIFQDNDYIFQQFTGLLDINGKEIYEGDIVKDLDKDFGAIEFSNGSFILNTKNRILPFWSIMVHNNMVYPRQINTNTLEIFGNIFENPELIEKK